MRPASFLAPPSRRLRCGALALGVALLGACAQKNQLIAMPAQEAQVTEQRYAGRLALKLAPFGDEAARGVNVAFDLQGSPTQGQLDLSTPMGTLVAQVRWRQATATMTTADGAETFDSLDALTRQVLGESLPVADMMSWLQGRPAPGLPETSGLPGGKPPLQFVQSGWDIDLRELDSGTLLAQRAATATQRGVTLRVRLDR